MSIYSYSDESRPAAIARFRGTSDRITTLFSRVSGRVPTSSSSAKFISVRLYRLQTRYVLRFFLLEVCALSKTQIEMTRQARFFDDNTRLCHSAIRRHLKVETLSRRPMVAFSAPGLRGVGNGEASVIFSSTEKPVVRRLFLPYMDACVCFCYGWRSTPGRFGWLLLESSQQLAIVIIFVNRLFHFRHFRSRGGIEGGRNQASFLLFTSLLVSSARSQLSLAFRWALASWPFERDETLGKTSAALFSPHSRCWLDERAKVVGILSEQSKHSVFDR